MRSAPAFLRAQAEGVSLQVRVTPCASRNELGGVQGDRLKVRIAAPPVDSAANDELVAFLAKQLGVARGDLQITQGRTARNKTVLVRGATVEHLLEWCHATG